MAKGNFFDQLEEHINAILDDAGKALDESFERLEREGVFRTSEVTLRQGGYRVTKDKGLVTIRVEVPGCTGKDLDIQLNHGFLTVTYPDFMAGGPKALARSLKFRLSSDTDSSDITAKCENGMLTILVKSDDVRAPKTGAIPVG